MVCASARSVWGIDEVKNRSFANSNYEETEPALVATHPCGRCRRSGDAIDKAAPKGRLILPQQQTIRDIIESGRSGCDHERERAETDA
jgi:hypothetical protein